MTDSEESRPQDCQPEGDHNVQFNVRIPASMRDEINARRNRMGLSRDEWTKRAIEWALKQPEGTPVFRARVPRQVRKRTT